MDTDYKKLKSDGFMHQTQHNKFSVRLKVVGGRLETRQLETIARAAEKFGDGHAHLTSRQGVEIPFVDLEDLQNLREFLASGGVEIGVCGARVRTVTACQGADVCRSGCISTYGLAKRISDRYYGDALPHKFKIGVTGCPNNCLKAEENDLGIKGASIVEADEDACVGCGACVDACKGKALSLSEGKVKRDPSRCVDCGQCAKTCPQEAWSEKPGYKVFFGGTFGNFIARGRQAAGIIESEETLMAVIDAALAFFKENGKPGERLARTLSRTGFEGLEASVRAAAGEEGQAGA